MSKYAKKVYACPNCWAALELGKKLKAPAYCSVDKAYINPCEMVAFDSIEEHRVGFELKSLEGVGKIQDLQHHEKFELLPEKELQNLISWHNDGLDWLYEIGLQNLRIPQPYGSYEADFTFIENDKKRVIEVKCLEKKKTKLRYVDPATGEKFIMNKMITRPFFTPQDPLSHFRVKCQLMKAIKHIDVEIWAGDKRFRFDDKWKLVEVTK